MIDISTGDRGAHMRVLANRNLHQMLVETKKGPAFRFDSEQQKAVREAIEEFCLDFRFAVKAIQITPTYTNLVISADAEPEDLIDDLKAAAAFSLLNRGLVADGVSVWSSARFRRPLWDETHLELAIRYTRSHENDCLPIFEDWLRTVEN
jgi:hypothetical protein